MIHIFEIGAIMTGVILFLAGHVWRETEIHSLRGRIADMKESRDSWVAIAGDLAGRLAQSRDTRGRFVRKVKA